MDTFADRGCVDRAPLVGRARELDRLEGLLRCRREGAGPVAVDVTGEPGIGKTRLLTEFAIRARGRGVTVLCGRAGTAEADGGTLFQAVLDAFADLDHQERAAAPALAELARLVEHGGLMGEEAGADPRDARRPGHRGSTGTGSPAAADAADAATTEGVPEAAARGSAVASAPGGQGHGERVRRIGAALGRVPAPGLVLLLDDLHRADPATVALVDHLLRHPLRAPVLVVVARRELQTPPALASCLARAADTGALARLDVGPLAPDDCAEGLAPGVPSDTVRELHTASGGNPLYFRALAHTRGRHGGAPGTGPVAVLLDELTPLGPVERAVVEAIAVLDGRATTELVAAVATDRRGGDVADVGDGQDGIDAALRALARCDLVRPDQDGRTLGPRHPALPELVRGALDPWRRRELHRRAAAALARAGAPATARAPHLVGAAAGPDAETAAVLVAAAERTGTVDPARAAHWLAAALDHLPDAPEHRADRHELMLRRAQALGSAGRVAESRDLLHRLIDMCRPDPARTEDAGDAAGPEDPTATEGAEDRAGIRTSAVLLCAFMERHLGRYPEADALLRRELERSPGPRAGLRTALVVEWGARALFATRYPEVRGEVARTLDDARRRRDEADTAEALTLSALGEAYEGETTTARARATEAAALTDAFTDGELADHVESLVRLGWTEAFLEEYGAAERHTVRGIAVARRAGRPFALSQLLLCSAYVHFVTGRVGAALDLAEESLTVAHPLGGAELLGFSRAIRATVLLHARPLGDPEGLAAAEEAAATVGTAQGWWATQARCMLAHSVPLGQDPHRVRGALLRAGGDRDLSRLQPSLRPGYLELLAGAALVAGDLPEAERVARRALTEAALLGLPVQRGAAHRAWGRVLAHRGESAAAAEAFTEAARESARSGAGLREAHSLLLAAPHVQAAGDGARAAALWRRGRRLAADGGALMLVDLADRTRPAPPDGGAPGGRLAVLTPREREISVLVAEGLTNQAVADRLCLSPRTVESHVARVYRKTGVETRAGLASLVVRTGVGGGQFSRG
ncbi:AAA family ATPase [Streptomyces sp. NPDC050842]|uniref:helix-turn-helix transcriptional regulator n=1 Tax=Streptomyces sp. NPDC050842 TaxID=3365636 RepID=UPI0037A243F8